MPCHTPPPPYEGEERRSAQAAVPLLCSLIGGLIADNAEVTREQLQWFISHRLLDAKIARGDGYYHRPDPQAEASAMSDVMEARKLLV